MPVVDCVFGGSPCQDLSVAGRRAGIKHEDKGDEETTRSGLFLDQMRIIREMRDNDRRTGRTGKFLRPRYMVWENVTGALTSPGNGHKGEDFAVVIKEIIKVAEPGASVSVRVPDGGWTKSGCYYAEDGSWSIAWRVHDAQFWGASQYVDGRVLVPGTPQRRRRIALVADFGGLSAPEILFERKGLSWDSGESRETREEAAGGIGAGAESAGRSCAISFEERAGKPGGGKGLLVEEDRCSALRSSYMHKVYDARGNGDGNTVCTITGDHNDRVTDYTAIVCSEPIPFDTTQVTSPANYSSARPGDPCHPLAATAHPPAIAFKQGNSSKTYGIGVQEEISPTLVSSESGTNMVPAVCVGNGQLNQISMQETANTLDAMHDAQAVLVPDVAHALKNKANCDFREDSETYVKQPHSMVRRLTPTECGRLQGLPDGWTDIGPWHDEAGKKHQDSDTAKYRAYGNSMCKPFWFWLIRRISAMYERPATLGSLFDGLGVAPLCWEQCNGVGTAVWASEIDQFCVNVTKKHFPELS